VNAGRMKTWIKLWLVALPLLATCASAQETVKVSAANNVVLVPVRVNERHLLFVLPKRFRAGLVVGNPLILQDESTWGTLSDSPTLNQ
jgi:hypothetical protein